MRFGGGAGLTLRFLAAFDVQCMMDPIQRAVAMPPSKIVMQRAARWKVFWDVPPLAAGAQDVHHAVHDGPNVDQPLTAAASRGRDQRLDICPFVISQVARISQVIAVVLRPVLVRPQWKPLLESRWAPSNTSDSKDSRSLRTDTKAKAAEVYKGRPASIDAQTDSPFTARSRRPSPKQNRPRGWSRAVSPSLPRTASAPGQRPKRCL